MNDLSSFFKELFEYNHHYNKKVSYLLKEHPENCNEECVKLFNHILNAHHIWNHRIHPATGVYTVWDIHLPSKYDEIMDFNLQSSLHILQEYDLNKSLTYTNSKGQQYTNTIRDIFFHVINHSTHHRAQIVAELKNVGMQPLVTDYIFYKR
jgi:uncharacterized damage-inducible protein DinB